MATGRRSCCCTAGACTAACSRRSCRSLTPRHRVAVVDLPGHGSSPPVVPYTLDALTDAVGGHDRRTPATVLRLVDGRARRAAPRAAVSAVRGATRARLRVAALRRGRRLAACDGGADARALRRRTRGRVPPDAAALPVAAGAGQRGRAPDARGVARRAVRPRRTRARGAGGGPRHPGAHRPARGRARASTCPRSWSPASAMR